MNHSYIVEWFILPIEYNRLVKMNKRGSYINDMEILQKLNIEWKQPIIKDTYNIFKLLRYTKYYMIMCV